MVIVIVLVIAVIALVAFIVGIVTGAHIASTRTIRRAYGHTTDPQALTDAELATLRVALRAQLGYTPTTLPPPTAHIAHPVITAQPHHRQIER
jgi:uncharacterized membrane protein